MKDYTSQELKDKYKNQKLIALAYKSSKEFYTVDDLSNFEELRFGLGEVNDHDAYITKTGFEFFKEVGISKISELLFSNQWYSDEFNSPEEIVEWFKSFNDFPSSK